MWYLTNIVLNGSIFVQSALNLFLMSGYLKDGEAHFINVNANSIRQKHILQTKHVKRLHLSDVFKMLGNLARCKHFYY